MSRAGCGLPCSDSGRGANIARIAQVVERIIGNDEVPSSTLGVSTSFFMADAIYGWAIAVVMATVIKCVVLSG